MCLLKYVIYHRQLETLLLLAPQQEVLMLLTERSSLYSHVISVLLALRVTHSSGKLNVKHIVY